MEISQPFVYYRKTELDAGLTDLFPYSRKRIGYTVRKCSKKMNNTIILFPDHVGAGTLFFSLRRIFLKLFFALACTGIAGPLLAQDFSEALNWYHKAAEQGYLGVMYLSGAGVSPNSYLAKQWLEKAAEQGHKSARA